MRKTIKAGWIIFFILVSVLLSFASSTFVGQTNPFNITFVRISEGEVYCTSETGLAPCTNSYDGNWDTFVLPSAATGFVYRNYTVSSEADYSLKIKYGLVSTTADVYCYTSSWESIQTISNNLQNTTFSIPSDCLDSNLLELRMDIESTSLPSPVTASLYEFELAYIPYISSVTSV